jgi:hypothetical protein
MQVVWRIPGSQSRGILCFCYGRSYKKTVNTVIYMWIWRTFGADITMDLSMILLEFPGILDFRLCLC